ncbi:hypothetical protein M3J09_010924 [Ascochyta lentis]
MQYNVVQSQPPTRSYEITLGRLSPTCGGTSVPPNHSHVLAMQRCSDPTSLSSCAQLLVAKRNTMIDRFR